VFGALNTKVIVEFDEICDNVLHKKPEILAMDCSSLDFIDSVGINHLFKLSHQAASAEAKFVLYDLNPTIRHIFQVTSLDKLLTILTKESFEAEYLFD
jgi:anti-sigma B factor antagonist